MTLESTINQNRYVGNGVATQFPFTFKVWKQDQVLVFVGDGREEQDVSSQCSIEITASGGSVSFSAAPASGTVVVIRRSMPYIQEDDYRNGTRFDAEEIEDRFDMDCAERQDLRLDIGRSVKVPLTSEETPEQFVQAFWDACAENQVLHNEVVELHADTVAEHERIAEERAEALQAVQDEGDHQVQRVQGAADSYYLQRGTGCMEMSWTLTQDAAANTDLDMAPLYYIVGRHHLRVSVNGVQQYLSKQYAEKGADGAASHVFTILVPLVAGDTVNVWVSHLAGAITASAEEDGLMAKEDKAKLDSMPAATGIARTTAVLASPIAAGTEIAVPAHAVGGGLLIVIHNGVVCEEGAGAQYLDYSSTSIKFNYDLAAGDTLTAVAVDISVP